MTSRFRLVLALAAALTQATAPSDAGALDADDLKGVSAQAGASDTVDVLVQAPGRPTPTPPLDDVLIGLTQGRQPDLVNITPEGAQLTFVMEDPADEILGATFQPVPPPVRAQLKLPKGRGLVVAEVDNDGPAAQVGLRRLDIITSLADQPVASTADIEKQLEAAGDKEVALTVLRHGRPVTLRVRPVRRVTFGPVEKESTEYVLGVLLGPLDDALRSQLGLGEKPGLVVNEVVPDSAAAKAGIKAHDILLKYDNASLANQAELARLVNEGKGKEAVIQLLREGKETSVDVTPERRTIKQAARPRNALRYFSVNPPQGYNPGLFPSPPAGMTGRPFRALPPAWTTTIPPRMQGGGAGEKAASEAQIEALKKQVDELRRRLESITKEKKSGDTDRPSDNNAA